MSRRPKPGLTPRAPAGPDPGDARRPALLPAGPLIIPTRTGLYANLVCGYYPGFRQWYIIQHWDGLGSQVQPQPFVTLVSYTVVVTGSLS